MKRRPVRPLVRHDSSKFRQLPPSPSSSQGSTSTSHHYHNNTPDPTTASRIESALEELAQTGAMSRYSADYQKAHMERQAKVIELPSAVPSHIAALRKTREQEQALRELLKPSLDRFHEIVLGWDYYNLNEVSLTYPVLPPFNSISEINASMNEGTQAGFATSACYFQFRERLQRNL